MTNTKRWLLTFVLGFAGGMLQTVASNGTHQPWDYIRSGLIGMAPAIGALKMTLEKPGGF
jgi:hypothetical protein